MLAAADRCCAAASTSAWTCSPSACHPPRRAGRRLFAAFAVLVVALILVRNGWETAMQSRQFGIVTEGQLEWPVWWLMLLLPLGGLLMGLVAIESLWRLALGLPVARGAHAAGATPGAGE